MGSGDLLGNAFRYTADGLVNRPVVWIVLVVMTQLYIIPLIAFVTALAVAAVIDKTMMSQVPLLATGIVATFFIIVLLNAFYNGYMVRVMHKEPGLPDFPGLSVLFADGIGYTVIQILYFLVPLLLSVGVIIISLVPFMNAGTGPASPSSVAAMQALLPALLPALLLAFLSAAVLFAFWAIAIVRFARTGSIREAFRIREILADIGRIGWGSYCFALLVLVTVLAVYDVAVFFIQSLFLMIPLIGFFFWLFMLLIQIVLAPFVAVFMHRYFSLLYDRAETA